MFRAMGPFVDINKLNVNLGDVVFAFMVGIRPTVGRSAVIPELNAGHLTEPPMSFPCAPAHIPVATATPAPPLDPPGVIAWSNGFRVAP
jgi:hypothetical protein